MTPDLSRMNVSPILHLIASISHKGYPSCPLADPGCCAILELKLRAMSPVSLEQRGYLEVMIPVFTQEWNNFTLGAAWTGRTWLLPEGGQVCARVWVGWEWGVKINQSNTITNRFQIKFSTCMSQVGADVGATSCRHVGEFTFLAPCLANSLAR